MYGLLYKGSFLAFSKKEEPLLKISDMNSIKIIKISKKDFKKILKELEISLLEYRGILYSDIFNEQISRIKNREETEIGNIINTLNRYREYFNYSKEFKIIERIILNTILEPINISTLIYEKELDDRYKLLLEY